MTAAAATAHPLSPTAGSAVAAAASAPASDHGFSFSDLLDIVNPLQHIPIVSTLYRAISGDQIKTFPKIAGDALFGGVTGFIGSVADTIFENITGRNAGDTVLAWIESAVSAPPTALAAAAPAQSPAIASASPDTLVIRGHEALLLTLTCKSVDQDSVLRAASAYRATLNLGAIATTLH